MIDLSGELSYVIKNGSITATLTPPNSGLVPVNLSMPLFNIKVLPQSHVLCLVEFSRCDSLGVCSNGRAVVVDLYSQQLDRVHEIFRRRYPVLVNGIRVLLQQDNARPCTARTTMAKIQEYW